MDTKTADALAWLLQADEPSVRYLTRCGLLGQEDSVSDRASITAGPWVSALLGGQHEDGGFGGDPYRKWTGAHWRLASLAEPKRRPATRASQPPASMSWPGSSTV